VYLSDVFISYAGDKDGESRDNRARAKRLNMSLKSAGFETWFVDQQFGSNVRNQMAKGIENSAVVLICVTRRYMEKVAEDTDSNCKFEFEYAVVKRGTLHMLPIVMEESMADTSKWNGSLSMTLGRHQYRKLMSDVDFDFDFAVQKIVADICKMIQPQWMLVKELREAACYVSRSQSPATSDTSGNSTSSSQSPPPQAQEVSQEVLAVRVDNDVSEFKEDMKRFVESFLDGRDRPLSRKRSLCELLLVAFMRNKVALSCDDVIAENLVVWQEKCEEADENLIDAFHKLMQSLKPHIFQELDYTIVESNKKNHISIFVINWIVQHSDYKIPVGKLDDWADKVVRQWFDSDNTETSDGFLERAETFLQKGVKGVIWGATILGKAIKVNSYVVFLRMGALSSLLVREHCDIGNRRHAHKLREVECTSECTPPLSITLVVSSSKWHLSLTKGREPSEAHISEIVWRLQRIASFPSEILKANECSFSQIERVDERVDWEHLYSLGRHQPSGGGDSIKRAGGRVDLLRVESASSGCAEESGDSSSLRMGPPTVPRPPD